jgi:hypothetical protein
MQLRPLQKGVARIAFEVSPSKKLSVVPVGIQYESSGIFRSRVLVNFGKPIFVNQFQVEDKSNREVEELFLGEVKLRLQELMLHIEDENYEEKLKYLDSYRTYSNNLVIQLERDKHTLSLFPEKITNSEDSGNNSFTGDGLLQKYVAFNLFLPGLLIEKLLLNRIKDPQFIRSVKFSAGQFLVPLFLSVQGYFLYLLSASGILSALYIMSVMAGVYFLNRPK